METSDNSYTRKSSNTSSKSYSQHSNDIHNNLNGMSINGKNDLFSQKSPETQNKYILQHSKDDFNKTYDDAYSTSFHQSSKKASADKSISTSNNSYSQGFENQSNRDSVRRKSSQLSG